ncbi:hypothetical protein ACLE20_13320 [Rhizobium sp. YIM 134829]|uniref:hypothetical protein n=1 Tax=Rhizobium sp. YIM 134829 TaxID=3390453 RepID=UPI003979FBAF
MGFQRVTINTAAPASIGTGIKVCLRKRKGQASMIFSIRSDIAKRLGWADGDKLEVLIGDGSDHGLVRLRKNNAGGDALVTFRKAMKAVTYVVVSLGHQSAFVDRAEAGRWCQHEDVEDGYLEIVLPRWADETGPKQAAKPAAAGSAPPAAAPPARSAPPAAKSTPARAVTASIMGDPPPGRREMLAKFGELKA